MEIVSLELIQTVESLLNTIELWTNALRDAHNGWLDAGGLEAPKEIRVVVNMKLMDSINLPLTYKNRFEKFQVQWNKQIQFHLEAFGNGKKSLTSRVKLYAAYPALQELHGDMSKWIYYT